MDSASKLPAGRLLWLPFVLSLGGYLLLAVWFPLLPHYNRVPLADVRALSDSPAGGLGYALLLTALFLLFGLAYRRAGRIPLRTLFLTTMVLALPLLFTFPINATDVYRYVIRGRIMVLHGENPYVVSPAELPDDPFTALAGEWRGTTTPYGPVWELLAAGLTYLTGGHLLGGLLLFKLLGLAAHLLIGLFIWLALAGREGSERKGRTLLWLWNPALLLVLVMDAHNDALLLLWLVAGYWLWRRERPLAGFLLMCLAPLTKGIGLLPLPLFFLAMVRGLPAGRARVRFAAGAISGGLLLAVLAFLPFGSPLDLALRLVEEAAENAGFSPLTLLFLLVQAVYPPIQLEPFVAAGSAIFLLLAIWLAWRVWRGRPAVRAAAEVFAAYVATALTFRIWYAAWPFPWLLLDEEGEKGRLAAGLWFLYATQLSVVIYGHVRYHLLSGSQLAAHLLGVPLVFLPPLLLVWRRLRGWRLGD